MPVDDRDNEWVEIKNPKCGSTPCHASQQAPNLRAPWTTARCNRLIRPLNSKITSLRKLRKLGSRELKTSQPDSVRIPSAKTVERSKRVWPKEFVEEGRETIPSATAYKAPTDVRVRIAERLVSSVDSSGSSSTDEETDLWSDVLGEERARKRVRTTYSTKKGLQSSTDAEASFHVQDQAQVSAQWRLREDALALSRQGVPYQPFLDQEGKLIDFQADAIDGKMTDSILPGDNHACARRLSREFRDLTKKLMPVNWRLVDNIYEHLDTLLRATSLDPDPKVGPRSLFKTCLKQITNCIKEEELRISEEDPDDKTDVATGILSELEALSVTDKEGWDPLKDVVRAHGIRLLADAIEEDLIGLPFARGLVILCLHRQALEEAQVIVKSMLRMMKPLSRPTCTKDKLFAFGNSITLHTMGLLHGAAGSNDLTFTYQQLAILFRNGILPIEWVACQDVISLLNGALLSITKGATDAAEAASLSQAIVSLMYGDMGEVDKKIEHIRTGDGAPHFSPASNVSAILGNSTTSSNSAIASELRLRASRTVNNMLTVLSAIEILRRPKSTVIENVGIEAQRAQELAANTPSRLGQSPPEQTQLGLTILAFNLVQTQIGHEFEQFPEKDQIRLGPHYAQLPMFIAPAGSLVCNVARCCGRAEAQDPFHHLRNLCRGLNLMSQNLDKPIQIIYDEICLAAGFEFAEETGQPKHLEWALDLERNSCKEIAGPTLRNPHKTSSSGHKSKADGYRWEDGICEWVAKTPVGSLSSLEQCCVRNTEDDGYINRTDGPPELSHLEQSSDLSSVSPSFKMKNKPKSQKRSEASHESSSGNITASVGFQMSDDKVSEDELSHCAPGSSDIEDLYNAEADELALFPTKSPSDSLQQIAEPGSIGSIGCIRDSKNSSGSLQKRAGITEKHPDVVSHANNDAVEPLPGVQESEDELSFA